MTSGLSRLVVSISINRHSESGVLIINDECILIPVAAIKGKDDNIGVMEGENKSSRIKPYHSGYLNLNNLGFQFHCGGCLFFPSLAPEQHFQDSQIFPA